MISSENKDLALMQNKGHSVRIIKKAMELNVEDEKIILYTEDKEGTSKSLPSDKKDTKSMDFFGGGEEDASNRK